MLRLDRYLVTLGVGSRSEVQRLIRRGAAVVDGSPVRDPGAQVPSGVSILLDGKALDTRLERHILLYKPTDLLTAARDKKQPTVMDLLPDSLVTLGCMPVGRLDRDTTGALLFTTDGEMNHRLLSPERHVDKVYLAEVDGPLTDREVAAFAEGLTLSDFTAKGAVLEIIESQPDAATARLTLREGKFHQVKRMFEAVGRTVTRLHRERFGPLTLEGLRIGQWRDLTQAEVNALRSSCGLSAT